MPIMPRINGKAKTIAYAILGRPANMRGKRKTASKIKRKLYAEETRLVK